MGNLAREKKINRGGEKPCVLDEERALLWEKNRKPLIDCDLRVVGFHLAEVRIQREVKRERILHHEFGIEAGAVFKFVQEHRRCAATRLIQKMIAGKKAVRNELNVAPRRHVFNPADRRELLGQPFHPLRHVGPVVVLALAQNRAIQRHPPGLFRTVRETQALERNGEENNIAILCHAAGTTP